MGLLLPLSPVKQLNFLIPLLVMYTQRSELPLGNLGINSTIP